MIYHAEMVGRAVQRALVVVDMPFPTFHLGRSTAIANAGADSEGNTLPGREARRGRGAGGRRLPRWLAAGIPVMGHVGLRPQTVHQMGGYKVQRDEQRLLQDAQAAVDAGAFSLVLECIPAEIAARITAALPIPTIGIGAGNQCDGQVLVLHDLLGLTQGYVPSFVRQYADLRTIVQEAVAAYCRDVASGQFPGPGAA